MPHSANTHSCSEFRELTRRQALLSGALGLSLPTLLAARSRAADTRAASPAGTFGRAKRAIILYLHGGHPQQETFDPKPEGPSAVRGEFSAISTAIPGVQFSEVLPKLATMADRLAIVRSMTHGNPNHVQASLPAGTGHAHSDQLRKRGDFPPSDTDFPPFGAVLSAVQPAASTLPTWVRIGPLMRRSNGTVLHGQLPGLLGQKHSSFDVDQKLLGDNVRVQAIEPQTELTPDRVTERRQLLGTIDQQRGLTEQSTGARDLEMFYQRAFSLLVSPQTREAFELASEPATTRELYGKTEFGQRCLLARRLAEAGVPIVNVSYCHTPRGSWDTHGNNFRSMKEHLGPTLDTALSGLLIDLEQRGLLDSTLVVVNAEFGRTPKINARAGRDHWPSVYSLALAGAGTAAGNVYGASDESAAYPLHNPHDPADFAATLYHLLGVPPDTLIHDATGRPHTVIIGRPISGLLS